MAEKKTKLTREDAAELYRDLHKTMSNMKKEDAQPKKNPVNSKIAEQIAQAIRSSMKKDDEILANGGDGLGPNLADNIPDQAHAALANERKLTHIPDMPQGIGSQFAIMVVVFFLFAKVSFSVFEYSGIFGVPMAQATLAGKSAIARAPFSTQQYTDAEVTVLKQLDARRVELEQRDDKLTQKERDIELKEQEFVARLAKIKELTDKLKSTREKNTAKRNNQLEQLSNVYGSMNPNEAAQLIEQLDVTIALALLERMPEKRIGQILSLMSPDRALTITRMLSTREAL